MNLSLEPISRRHQRAFIEAVRRSQALHGHWISAPNTRAAFRDQVRKCRGDRHMGFVIRGEDVELIGCINLNDIVRGSFQSAHLGYYAFTPYAGRGLMKIALRQLVTHAFGPLGLHRLEANIQPGNASSKGLVKSLGFRFEGVSPRYLKINGAWRDHEHYAITREEWPD
jgi:ribosomal-protein-alanine N-acetyltransferase